MLEAWRLGGLWTGGLEAWGLRLDCGSGREGLVELVDCNVITHARHSERSADISKGEFFFTRASQLGVLSL